MCKKSLINIFSYVFIFLFLHIVRLYFIYLFINMRVEEITKYGKRRGTRFQSKIKM